MSTFKFRLENNGKIKEIKTDTILQDWKMFRTSMKTFQKNINDYLTSMVNMEGSAAGINDFINEESGSSEDEEKSPKRVLDLPNELVQKSNKIPKI